MPQVTKQIHSLFKIISNEKIFLSKWIFMIVTELSEKKPFKGMITEHPNWRKGHVNQTLFLL